MKKVIMTVLPCLLILLLTFLMRDGKDILWGIYIIFPVIYILIGFVHTKLKWELVICLLLTSLSFLIPVNLLFNMGTCIELAVIYNALAAICFIVKNTVKKAIQKRHCSE